MLRSSDDFQKEASVKTVAVNYAIYRNEVFRYVFSHKGFTGEIPLAALNMPQSWIALRPWRSRVEANRCYVFGQASQEEILAIRQLFMGSFALGMVQNGQLVPLMGNPIPVPASIPNGSLASVTEVN